MLKIQDEEYYVKTLQKDMTSGNPASMIFNSFTAWQIR